MWISGITRVYAWPATNCATPLNFDCDWGTGTVANKKRIFSTYDEAVMPARAAQLTAKSSLSEVDDTKNDPWRWSTYISHCAIRWLRDPHKWTREDTDDFYDAMIETAAICAAAAESVVRQRNTSGRTFYEPALGT